MKFFEIILKYFVSLFLFTRRRLAFEPKNITFGVIAVLLIIGWHAFAVLRLSRLFKIADELGSVRQFVGNPLPNFSGTKVLTLQTMENGVGLYLYDVSSGQRQLLMEQEESNYRAIDLLGWSPDDKLFAFSEGRKISIGDEMSGEILATVKLKDTNRIALFTWVSPKTFVFSDRSQTLFMSQRLPKRWTSPSQIYVPIEDQSPTEVPLTGLTSDGNEHVFWQQQNAIWSCDLKSGFIRKIWESTNCTLLGFSYLEKNYEYVLHCRGRDGEYLDDFSLRTMQSRRLVEIGLRGDPSLFARDNSLLNVVSFNDGRGCAWITRDVYGQDTLVCKTNLLSTVSQKLLWEGEIKDFWADNNAIYLIGSKTNEPLGLWKYDPMAETLNCLLSDQDYPFKYAKNVVPQQYLLTNAENEVMEYHVLPPANFSPRKKYPLVIGMLFVGELANNQYSWQDYEQVAANDGCYFVVVPRGNSAEDMLAVYEALAKNPNIDNGRIYLLGLSGGNGAVANLLKMKPELWHGAIFLSPVAFPDILGIKVQNILIDCGGQDSHLSGGGFDALKNFQDSAFETGISVRVNIHPGTGHIYRSFSSEKERLQLIAEFLFNG